MPGKWSARRCSASCLHLPQAPWRAISNLARRFDNLSHVLVWSNSHVDPMSSGNQCAITSLEFPRLRLNFRAVKNSTGGIVLMSEEHSGLFISNERCEMSSRLLQGLPHSLLLKNANGELFIMLPACAKPTRPTNSNAHFQPRCCSIGAMPIGIRISEM